MTMTTNAGSTIQKALARNSSVPLMFHVGVGLSAKTRAGPIAYAVWFQLDARVWWCIVNSGVG